jgi:ankyrin repeat protein
MATADVVQGALRRALTSNNLAALVIILQSQESLTVDYKTLTLAIRNRQIEALRLMLASHNPFLTIEPPNDLLAAAYRTGDGELIHIVQQCAVTNRYKIPWIQHRDLFLNAVELPETVILRTLLEFPLSASVSITDSPRQILSRAASLGNEEALRILLRRWVHFDSNALGKVLFEQCESGSVAVVQILLEHGANIDQRLTGDRTALSEACASGHIVMARLLIAHGAEVNSWSQGGTPIFAACINGRDAMVQLLLEHGAEMKSPHHGETPLFAACMGGHAAVVQLLIEHGAAFDSPDDSGNATGHFARILLFVACLQGNTTIVRMLISYGAEISDELVLWLRKQQYDEFESLMRIFASENVPSTCSPPVKRLLSVASRHGFENIVQSLFQNGAKFSAKEHFDAFSAASRRSHSSVVKTLIANESDLTP